MEKVDFPNKTLIGSTSGKRLIYSNDEAKHIFICGTTGSGKTVAISNYIKTAIDKNYPLLIIDGKGDTSDGSILDIVNKLNQRRKKVYVINMSNPINSSKYNPFKNASATICKDMLINLTYWSEEHYKLNTERYLERLIHLLKLAKIPLSLKAIVKYATEDRFKVVSSEVEKTGLITKEEHLDNMTLAKESVDIIRGAVARFAVILESDIGSIFDDEGIDIYEALEERAIILFILNPLSYPELSPLIGKLALVDSKKAVSKLYREPLGRVFFVFDEINVYISTTLIDLINKSRSANITCIPATQSLADLEFQHGEALKTQVIENCNNYIIMRQNSAKSSEEWAKTIGTKNAMEVTYKIEQSKETSSSTGTGSVRKVREFIFHPDDIKSLRTGEAFYISKDDSVRHKIKVNKPF